MDKGYSLLEVIIVVSITTIVLGLGSIAFNGALSGYKLDDAGRKLKSAFYSTKQLCMTYNMRSTISEGKGFIFELKDLNDKSKTIYVANDDRFIFTSDIGDITYMNDIVLPFPEKVILDDKGTFKPTGCYGIRIIDLDTGESIYLILYSTGFYDLVKQDGDKWISL